MAMAMGMCMFLPSMVPSMVPRGVGSGRGARPKAWPKAGPRGVRSVGVRRCFDIFSIISPVTSTQNVTGHFLTYVDPNARPPYVVHTAVK